MMNELLKYLRNNNVNSSLIQNRISNTKYLSWSMHELIQHWDLALDKEWLQRDLCRNDQTFKNFKNKEILRKNNNYMLKIDKALSSVFHGQNTYL
jgi:hypothetical protein